MLFDVVVAQDSESESVQGCNLFKPFLGLFEMGKITVLLLSASLSPDQLYHAKELGHSVTLQ